MPAEEPIRSAGACAARYFPIRVEPGADMGVIAFCDGDDRGKVPLGYVTALMAVEMRQYCAETISEARDPLFYFGPG